jgi:hypothetical protein
VKNTIMRRYNSSGRAFQLLVAGAAGALVGLIVFTIDHITGRTLYLIIGAALGLAISLTPRRFWGVTRLTELTITVPQLSELKFVVNNESRHVAWQFYIEVVTRVSTQPLGDGDGSIRETLTSLHGLFATTRDILRASRPSIPASSGLTVEHLAVTMLNLHLRPFLAKWHSRLREFETGNSDCSESSWPENQACRSELRQVQKGLADFALGFASLAGVHNPDKTFMPAAEGVD